MLSAICVNLDQFNILPSDNGLRIKENAVFFSQTVCECRFFHMVLKTPDSVVKDK